MSYLSMNVIFGQSKIGSYDQIALKLSGIIYAADANDQFVRFFGVYKDALLTDIRLTNENSGGGIIY